MPRIKRYNPNKPANDVAREGEGCQYCGQELTAGEPVVRAAHELPGRVRPNCRHPFDCMAKVGNEY